MTKFDLAKLVTDVFEPEANDRITVMTDLPHDEIKDGGKWEETRGMAEEWRARLTKSKKFNVTPLFTYPATGLNNGDLPKAGMMSGKEVSTDDVMKTSTIIIAMTGFSASAPLNMYSRKYKGLRVASMPRAEKRMEKTGLAADHKKIAQKCEALSELIDPAVESDVEFSTGHRCHFDLRYNPIFKDDGRLSRKVVLAKGYGLINLPCGEVCQAPNEGADSVTAGEIPVMYGDELVVFKVDRNKITEVVGSDKEARAMKEYFDLDPARRNIAEFALGCNDMAVVTGNVVEDEKVEGFHWAYGRSDMLEGKVGPASFKDPKNVVHQDTVYAKKSSIFVKLLTLKFENGRSREVLLDGKFIV